MIEALLDELNSVESENVVEHSNNFEYNPQTS
jgi:hypothetical protein